MAMAAGNGGGFGEDAEYRPISEINITPMVDVMLVLLIIFMVTAPLLVAGVPVELPNTSAARISQPKKPVIVSLGDDGSLYIRDEQVRALAKRLAVRRGQTVTQVVRSALQREADEDERGVQAKLAALKSIQARVAALPELRPGLTDADLYDADGNPVL